MLKNRGGQSILDYVFLVCIVIVGLLIMGYYIRNSLSGRFRETADVFGSGEVYHPGKTVVGD
jgi:hypothetical protein